MIGWNEDKQKQLTFDYYVSADANETINQRRSGDPIGHHSDVLVHEYYPS